MRSMRHSPPTTISSGDARRDARLTALLAAKLARENGVSISPATSTLAPKPYPAEAGVCTKRTTSGPSG